MTKHRFTLLDTATVVVVAVILAAAVWIAVAGPTGPLAMHFDIQGRPNRWGDRNELAGTFLFMGVTAGLIAGGMSWFAARAEDPARRRGLHLGQLVTLLIIAVTTAVMGVTILGAAQEGTATIAGWATAGVALIILVTGAFLGRVGPNPFVGVRTPWSYKSRLAWDRSNRLAGRLFFWLGLTGLLIGPFLPQAVGMTTLVVAILAAAAWSAFESWRVWRTDPDRQPF